MDEKNGSAEILNRSNGASLCHAMTRNAYSGGLLKWTAALVATAPGFELLMSPLEPIANAAHRDDPRRVGGIDLDLPAQPAHVHIERMRIAVENLTPDAR